MVRSTGAGITNVKAKTFGHHLRHFLIILIFLILLPYSLKESLDCNSPKNISFRLSLTSEMTLGKTSSTTVSVSSKARCEEKEVVVKTTVPVMIIIAMTIRRILAR